MGLLIYQTANPASAFSAAGLFTNPLVQTFNGVAGSIVERRYYVRNDNVLNSYSGVTVQPRLVSGDNIFNGTNGFSWKLIIGDAQPLEEQWSLVAPGAAITIPDIGTALVADVATFEPFWLRMTVPRGASVESFSGIVLDIAGTETLVP